MAAVKVPLPNFLNLPLPPINQPKQSKSDPPIFKLTLSADQFDELLRMDAEVEEGEEGGLRLEFDPNQSNVGRLHLNPTRTLSLNPPRSGPIRTNKPEEIYHHTPLPNQPQSRSPLTGLLRIPVGTPFFALQPTPSEPAPQPQQQPQPSSSHQPSRDVQAKKLVSKNEPEQPPNLRSSVSSPHTTQPQPQPSQREKEKMAGQRLKEKRQEAELKKREKRTVLLPTTTLPTGPKKGRPVKPKESKQKSASSTWPSSAAAPTTTKATQPASSNPTNEYSTRRTHSGSNTAPTPEQSYSNNWPNPSAPLPKSLDNTPPLPPPLINTVSPSPQSKSRTKAANSGSNRRAKPPSLTAPSSTLLPNPQISPEPYSATKLSATSTVLTSLSEESEPDPRSLEQAQQASGRRQKPPNGRNIPAGPAKQQASKTTNRRGSTKPPTEPATAAKSHSPMINQPLESASFPDEIPAIQNSIPSQSTQPKRRRQIDQSGSPAVSANSTPAHAEGGADRPKKAIRKENGEKRAKPSPGLPPPEGPAGRPAGNLRTKKVPISENPEGVIPSNRKRTLEADQVTSNANPSTKRSKPEQAGTGTPLAPMGAIMNPVTMGAPPVLPTIRKVNRESEEVHSNNGSNGTTKKVKKKKKIKAPVDYTSSEAEEGEQEEEEGIIIEKKREPKTIVVVGGGGGLEDERRTNTKKNVMVNNNRSMSSKEYQKNRMVYHELYEHYRYVCERIENIRKSNKSNGGSSSSSSGSSGRMNSRASVEEIEELMNEYIGLENELENVRKSIMMFNGGGE